MPRAGSIATRFASVIEGASGRQRKGGGLFARIIEALHVSRRIEARRVLVRYRHLIVDHFQSCPTDILTDFNKAKESSANAEIQTRVRAGERKFQDA